MTDIVDRLTQFLILRSLPLYPDRDNLQSNAQHAPAFDLVLGTQVTATLVSQVIEPLMADFVLNLQTFLDRQPVGQRIDIDEWVENVLQPNLNICFQNIVDGELPSQSEPVTRAKVNATLAASHKLAQSVLAISPTPNSSSSSAQPTSPALTRSSDSTGPSKSVQPPTSAGLSGSGGSAVAPSEPLASTSTVVQSVTTGASGGPSSPAGPSGSAGVS